MAHKFPKYQFSANEPIAHEEINTNLRAFRDELGCLNEHNVKEHCFSDRTHAEPDFAIQVNNEVVEFNPYMNYGDGTSDGDYPGETQVPPAPYTDDRITVDGGAEWQVVQTYTKFTGNSLLWIIASFQQQTYSPDEYVGGVYALRINGTIIDETRTGGTDRTNDPVGTGTACQAYPYVLDLVLPVPPGGHVVELVAKAPQQTASSWIQPDSDSMTMVFNRELIILTLDPETEAVDGTTGDFSPLEEGDTIDAITTQAPFDDVRDGYNAIEYPDIQPESLTAAHCPSTVLDADQVTVGTLVTHSYTNEYPGFGDDTMGGWAVVDDGTDQLEVFITTVDMTDTALVGILVGVDINVINIDPDPGVTTTSDQTYCIIALQYRDDAGSWRTVAKTERYVNSEYDPDTGAQLALRKNIGFRTLLTLDDVDGSTEVDGLRCVVSVFDRSNSASATVELQQGSLWYAVLQGGT